MQSQLILLDPMLVTAFTNQFLGQAGRFAVGHHPAHRLAAEDVQDHVQVVVGPLSRAPDSLCRNSKRSVPWPTVPASRRRDDAVGSAAREPPDSHPNPDSHRGAQWFLVQQGRGDLCGRLVHEALTMQHVEDLLALHPAQRPMRSTGRCRLHRGRGFPSPVAVERRARNAKDPTCRRRSQLAGELSAASISRSLRRPDSSGGFPGARQLFFGCRSPFRLAPFLSSRRVSRASCAIRLSRGSFALRFRSSLRPSTGDSPASCCRRQVLRLDEYTPPGAATPPPRLASALVDSRTIRLLYAAVNRRRVALSATSGSGASPFRPAASGATPVALRAPSVPPDSSFSCSALTPTQVTCLPALAH